MLSTEEESRHTRILSPLSRQNPDGICLQPLNDHRLESHCWCFSILRAEPAIIATAPIRPFARQGKRSGAYQLWHFAMLRDFDGT